MKPGQLSCLFVKSSLIYSAQTGFNEIKKKSTLDNKGKTTHLTLLHYFQIIVQGAILSLEELSKICSVNRTQPIHIWYSNVAVVMGIESERTALSIESIPKSVSEVQMEQPLDTLSSENPEPPERQSQQKGSEKNGNLDFLI